MGRLRYIPAFPSTKVFVDGRSDFYGAKFGRKFLEVMDGKYDWKGTLDRYGIEAVLLPVDCLSGQHPQGIARMAPRIRRWGGHPVPDTDAGAAARAARPESVQSSAVGDGGIPVIARSPTIK